MRSFAQPKVLSQAALAALGSGLACYPRLATWSERLYSVSFLWLILLWALFVLWGFVFAWQFQYAHRPVLGLDFQPKLWGATTLSAAVAGLLVHLELDPKLRALTPGLYPTDWNSWLVMGLFALALEPLFLCFAPFAFFIRLFRKQDAALALTVVFGLFVLALRLSSNPALPAPWLIVEMLAFQVLAGFAWLYLYLKGGALLVWWAALILHLRLLLDLSL